MFYLIVDDVHGAILIVDDIVVFYNACLKGLVNMALYFRK